MGAPAQAVRAGAAGGGGRNHRPDRRAAEIEYLRGRGVRLVVSVMRYAPQPRRLRGGRAGLAPRAGRSAADGAEALEELLPLLRDELRPRGAVALHGDSYTDFVAAVCAAHLHEARGVDPAEALARAARAGLTVDAGGVRAAWGSTWGRWSALMQVA